MDQLLQSACHVRTLNLFVESFLKTIQKLLESPDPDLQILASASFLRFSKLEEETPSYHRSYDFFISRFAQMCLSNHNDTEGIKMNFNELSQLSIFFVNEKHYEN